MKRGDKEKQFKKSFIKIGYEMRELWKFEKSWFTFYGDPQIGNIASKWQAFVDNSPYVLYTKFKIFSIISKDAACLFVNSTYVV